MSTILDAVEMVSKFKGGSITKTIFALQKQLVDADQPNVLSANQRAGIDQSLLIAVAVVKQASAQIDVVIHTVGILYALPHILNEGELVESVSLGADNASSGFDLITDRRIAEFKFIKWQKKGNAIRNKTLFEDFYKLAREQTPKRKYLYLLDVATPLRFLQGNRDILKVLDRNRRLAKDFEITYGQTYRTVGEFYRAFGGEIHLIDLVKTVPEFETFINILPVYD